MNINAFSIYVEQLRDGHVEKIHEVCPADFLQVSEKDLRFVDQVKVDGEAYLAENELVLHLKLQATAVIPCSICNQPVKTAVQVVAFYQTIPLQEIKSGIYHMEPLIRENILLETPTFAECNQGKCPERKDLKKFLKEEEKEEEEGYKPFENLEL